MGKIDDKRTSSFMDALIGLLVADAVRSLESNRTGRTVIEVVWKDGKIERVTNSPTTILTDVRPAK